MNLRKRALPDGWYPGSGDRCKNDIESFLRCFSKIEGVWRGAVVPHAGWFFSGRATARALSLLSGSHADRVVIFGGHLPPNSKPIVYTEDAWETPLGPQKIDSEFSRELVRLGVGQAAGAGFVDNTVEIQLPFIKCFFEDVPIIAIHSPASTGAVDLALAVDSLLDKPGYSAVYVGSADLTHYGPNYGFMPMGKGAASVEWVKNFNDKSIVDKATAMNVEGVLEDAVTLHNTCSAGPIVSVMVSVEKFGVTTGRLVEYYTSYDIQPASSFVGYASIVY
jgi:MEMO1 family protein